MPSSVPKITANPSLADIRGTRDALVNLLMLIARKCPPSAMSNTVWDSNALDGKAVHYNITLPNVDRRIAERMTHVIDRDTPPHKPEPGIIPRIVDTITKSQNVQKEIKDFIAQHFIGCSANGLWFDRERNPHISEQSYITIGFKVPPSEARPITLPSHKSRGDHTDARILHQDPMTEMIMAIQQLSDDELRGVLNPFADRLTFNAISQSLNSGIKARG